MSISSAFHAQLIVIDILFSSVLTEYIGSYCLVTAVCTAFVGTFANNDVIKNNTNTVEHATRTAIIFSLLNTNNIQKTS